MRTVTGRVPSLGILNATYSSGAKSTIMFEAYRVCSKIVRGPSYRVYFLDSELQKAFEMDFLRIYTPFRV